MSQESSNADRVATESPEGSVDATALAADLRTLVQRIEAIHPDPYQGYDGRVSLHAALESTIQQLPETLTEEQCYRRAAELVAGLEDAHSRVAPPEATESNDRRLPISLRVVGQQLYVDAVYDDSLTDLLGTRLLAVEGEPLDRIAERYTSLRGAENEYFTRLVLGEKIQAGEWLNRLLGGDQTDEELTLRVCTGEGTERERTLSFVSADSEPVVETGQSITPPTGTGPRYRLYEDGQIAVFDPGNLSQYREVVQAARARDTNRADSLARDAYRAHYDGPVPDDIDDMIDQLPSMVETLIDLVTEMERAETETLILDLRDNSGGDSRFLQYLGYVLYGWERLVETYDWGVAIKRRTEPHREAYGVPDGEQPQATFADNPASYDFSQEFRARELSTAERADAQRMLLGTGRFAEELADEAHENYYEPEQVIVTTTAGTMSSAFAGAALLSEFGADVVGVPSGQAPQSFGEAVSVELPNTGLEVDIAGSLFRWTPEPTGSVLPMTHRLTPDRFENQYDCAGDAILQLAFDHADAE
jgi:hypothetical protein